MHARQVPERETRMPMKIRRSCREVTRLVLESQERRLGTLEKLSLRFHWGICGACLRFYRQAQLMQRSMDRWRAYRDAGD